MMQRHTIKEVSTALGEGTVTSRQLTEEVLGRIDQFDTALNSFISVTKDEALAAAKAAEVEIGSGKYRGPMHGIPVGVKDQFDIKGYPNTGGCDA